LPTSRANIEMATASSIPGPRLAPHGASLQRGRRTLLFAGAALLIAAWQSISGWRDHHAFLINASQSLPNWAFLIERGRMPARGDYVFFDPPRDPLILRHFGANPATFGKIVYGVGGDSVTREGRTYFVNGREVATAKLASHVGEPLALGPVGIIPAGCYFVGSPHKDGLDSRYAAVGWPCDPRIIGTGTPIL
jgi:conjugal transfer pilin signal peptidase TrbI